MVEFLGSVRKETTMLTRRFPMVRHTAARNIREEAAAMAVQRPQPEHINNCEETEYRDFDPAHPAYLGALSYIANFSKGLHHTAIGEVVRDDYHAMLHALYSGNPLAFENIPVGTPGGLRLTNPQAGLAFDLEIPDVSAFAIPPAPRIDSAEFSLEMAELYWMALCRDVHFNDYGTGANTDSSNNKPSLAGLGLPPTSLTQAGVNSLTTEFTHFASPKYRSQRPAGITAGTLFRGIGRGVNDGPYLSQFVLKDILYGTIPVQQKRGRVKDAVRYLDDTDYLIKYAWDPGDPLPPPGQSPYWIDRQNGVRPRNAGPIALPAPDLNPANAVYIRNLRDLTTYVHFCTLYDEYLNAALVLNDLFNPAPWDPGHPYGIGFVQSPYQGSNTQEGFVTFGLPHLYNLIAEVATRAQKVAWYQKWFVHRRARPEEIAGRIDIHAGPASTTPGIYLMINNEILDSLTGGDLHAFYPGWHGNYLLPQAYEEGCPLHPSLPSGHATVAGACVTILKAWYDESYVIPNPQVPNANGTALNNYIAPAGEPPLTVGGELNKLAANISFGRNAAGIHYWSDYTEGLRLGEQVAIEFLREQKLTFNQDFYFTFSFTTFDGRGMTI